MAHKVDISVCINLHGEGRLCRPTIESALSSIKYAECRGARCELLLLLDNPDLETIDSALIYSSVARIEQFKVGDLGEARNLGVQRAAGRYCAFLDGDDLFGESWLWGAISEAKSDTSRDLIIHPKTNLFFGRGYNPYYWSHPDMRVDKISISRLVVENLWTSLCFTKRTAFLKMPYLKNRISDGFGYEDWSWNVRTITDGFLHVVAPDTIHFIRRKPHGSLLQNSAQKRVIPDLLDADLRNLLLKKLRAEAVSV